MAIVRYLGHSSFQLEMGGQHVWFDPWFDESPQGRNRLLAPAITRERLPRYCDIICISNESFDHCSPEDVKALVQRTNAYVVAPSDSLGRLEIPLRSKVSAEVGDRFTLLGVDVQVLPANHPPNAYPVGYIVRAGGQSVYFAGLTYEFGEMREIAVDLAILPIGGSFSMDSIGAVNALKQMRAKFVVPMHYNTFERIRVDEKEFFERVRRSTRSMPLVLQVGQAAEF